MKHDRKYDGRFGWAVFAILACVGCHAQAKASVGGRDDLEGNASANGTASTDAPKETTTTAPPPADTTTAPAQTAAPASACPMVCTEHDGATARPLTADDNARMSTAFAGGMNDLRACAPGGWRRRGSPTFNLRFDGKGVLQDVGVDLTGYDGNELQCLETVPHPSPDVSYPGPADVRCQERCTIAPSVTSARRHGKK